MKWQLVLQFPETDAPEEIFERIMKLIDIEDKTDLKAAYREIRGEKYIILWPHNLKEFKVK